MCPKFIYASFQITTNNQNCNTHLTDLWRKSEGICSFLQLVSLEGLLIPDRICGFFTGG
jgi:hypothetical protein